MLSFFMKSLWWCQFWRCWCLIGLWSYAKRCDGIVNVLAWRLCIRIDTNRCSNSRGSLRIIIRCYYYSLLLCCIFCLDVCVRCFRRRIFVLCVPPEFCDSPRFPQIPRLDTNMGTKKGYEMDTKKLSISTWLYLSSSKHLSQREREREK